MKEFDVILCLFVLQAIFLRIGPVSQVLQSVDADLSVSMSLLRGCVVDLSEMRNDTDSHWKSIVECASKFATEHDIEPQLLSNKRKRKTKRLHSELASDECDAPNLETFKIELFVKEIDSVLMQLKDHFSDSTMDIVHEMPLFSPVSITSNQEITEQDASCAIFMHLTRRLWLQNCAQ